MRPMLERGASLSFFFFWVVIYASILFFFLFIFFAYGHVASGCIVAHSG